MAAVSILGLGRPPVTGRTGGAGPVSRWPGRHPEGWEISKKDRPPGRTAPREARSKGPSFRFSFQRTRYNQRLLLSGRLRRRGVARRLLLGPRPARLDAEAEERLVVEAEAAPEERREQGPQNLPPLLELPPLPHRLLKSAAQVLLLPFFGLSLRGIPPSSGFVFRVTGRYECTSPLRSRETSFPWISSPPRTGGVCLVVKLDDARRRRPW
jgi:hypothetical protein